MEFLGFSEEDIDKLNSRGSSKKTVEYSPIIDPIPDLSAYSEEVRSKYIQLRESETFRLKQKHLNQNISNTPNDKNLNSQLARVQKFVKKLKSIGEENREEILSELKDLSLKKFISEAAHSLSESRMAIKDIPVIIEVCCKLHQNYPDFQKTFEGSLKKQHKEGDFQRKRNIIRLITEMITFGLWSDINGYIKVIRDYVRFY